MWENHTGHSVHDLEVSIYNWKGSHIESKYPGLLSQSLDVVPAVVYSKSIPDLKYLLANPMYYRAVKTPKDNILGLTDKDIFPPEVAEELAKNDLLVAESQQSQNYHEKVPHPDGSIRDYDSYKFPIFDQTGRVFAVTGVSLDITEKIKSEVVLRNNTKMASLGKFAGGIAHEINNPLTIISGASQALRKLCDEPNPDRSRVKDLLHKIENTVDRISGTVKGLVTFAREGSVDSPITIDICTLLDNTINLIRVKYDSHQFKTPVIRCRDEILVKCSPVQISQVMLNLLDNAIYEAQKSDEDTIEIRLKIDGSSFKFEVSNTTGASESEIAKFFEPFYTTKPFGQGTGLGLSLSKGLVEAHGGTIGVFLASKSTANKRANNNTITFYFTLPLKK